MVIHKPFMTECTAAIQTIIECIYYSFFKGSTEPRGTGTGNRQWQFRTVLCLTLRLESHMAGAAAGFLSSTSASSLELSCFPA